MLLRGLRTIGASKSKDAQTGTHGAELVKDRNLLSSECVPNASKSRNGIRLWECGGHCFRIPADGLGVILNQDERSRTQKFMETKVRPIDYPPEVREIRAMLFADTYRIRISEGIQAKDQTVLDRAEWLSNAAVKAFDDANL
jgi:hypothetical protein